MDPRDVCFSDQLLAFLVIFKMKAMRELLAKMVTNQAEAKPNREKMLAEVTATILSYCLVCVYIYIYIYIYLMHINVTIYT
jgi:hypothetical protein